MAERKPTLSVNPKPAIKKKLEEFAHLYRGGPDEIRGNAARCYMKLHPRCKTVGTAEVKGAEYLKHPIVQELIREKTDAVAASADITQDRVLREIARIGFFDASRLLDDNGNPLPMSKLDKDVVAAIAGVKVLQVGGKGDEESIGTVIEYKIADKNTALEKLMRYLGAYEKDNKQKGLLADLPRDVLQMITDKLRDEV